MMSECKRCGGTILDGLPAPGMSKLTATITRDTHRIRFNYLRMNGWRDSPRASDVVQSLTYTDVTLCSDCWGDVLHFICTTKPEHR